jgi:hypothetical protein
MYCRFFKHSRIDVYFIEYLVSGWSVLWVAEATALVQLSGADGGRDEMGSPIRHVALS